MDEVFTSVCIRATLDVFWSWSSGTVIKHLTEVRFICRYAERLDIVKPFPRLGHFLRGHHLGMLQAMMVVMRSMEPGRGRGGRVKYGTARKIRSAFTVIWDNSPEAKGDLALSDGGYMQPE